MELSLPPLPALERCGVWESVAIALAETMAKSGHYEIDSTTVRAHVSAAGGKGGFINELLAARGAGSPVKFQGYGALGRGSGPSVLKRIHEQW
jgi:hypothetical protein